MNIIIRQEKTEDYKAVEAVVRQAFANVEISDQTEHQLVARLRDSDAYIPELSLVAFIGVEVVGHIMFSKAIIGQSETLALAPVSVLPEYQNKGIGTALITEGLDRAKALGFASAIVLGHPGYYPKFGFKKASLWGIKAPWDVPDEVFMAIELKPESLKGVSGIFSYSSEF
ncbi:GNAT family N-acetyltransferase [Bacillus sp. B-jedd]|uniref:GNAT family N-acetyltransferase n=1 Tax=Bacillus sp. B-jedd TaxID=1476857 RepID=UPI00051560F3|nr:N-acetyltransferase [Bacillus sp. B-jedd]CEG29671.1 GNAT family acetyltransferase [Bacillus sp. B-jedd]